MNYLYRCWMCKTFQVEDARCSCGNTTRKVRVSEGKMAEYAQPDESAWGKQVGGDHYKNLAISPALFCYRNGFNNLVSNIVKYVARYQWKSDPLEDLEKARHYLDMLIEEVKKEKG